MRSSLRWSCELKVLWIFATISVSWAWARRLAGGEWEPERERRLLRADVERRRLFLGDLEPRLGDLEPRLFLRDLEGWLAFGDLGRRWGDLERRLGDLERRLSLGDLGRRFACGDLGRRRWGDLERRLGDFLRRLGDLERGFSLGDLEGWLAFGDLGRRLGDLERRLGDLERGLSLRDLERGLAWLSRSGDSSLDDSDDASMRLCLPVCCAGCLASFAAWSSSRSFWSSPSLCSASFWNFLNSPACCARACCTTSPTASGSGSER